ncbi:hypothetical protein WME89_02775 [Sorangium sp. So ce321]|uniref:hypothetical protein n=1 Tax=Sorangium sp. So ce321 TaxID=3133300 RepID=UPI003F627CFE
MPAALAGSPAAATSARKLPGSASGVIPATEISVAPRGSGAASSTRRVTIAPRA